MLTPKEFPQIVLDLYSEGPRLRPTLDALLWFYSKTEYKGIKNYTQIVLDLYRSGEMFRQTLKNILHFYASELNRGLDAGGNTLLHYAYTYRDVDMIEFLLYFGANPAIKNYAGKMPTERL